MTFQVNFSDTIMPEQNKTITLEKKEHEFYIEIINLLSKINLINTQVKTKNYTDAMQSISETKLLVKYMREGRIKMEIGGENVFKKYKIMLTEYKIPEGWL